MAPTENNGFNHFKTNFGIYLFEMTAIENQTVGDLIKSTGIDLLEMTTIENSLQKF